MPQMLESEVGIKTSRASGFRTVPRRGCERRAGLLSLIIAASLADQHPWPVEYGAIPRRRNPQAGCSYATARNPGRPSACFSLVDRDGPRSDKRLSGEVRVLRRRLGGESQAPDRGTHFRIFRAPGRHSPRTAHSSGLPAGLPTAQVGNHCIATWLCERGTVNYRKCHNGNLEPLGRSDESSAPTDRSYKKTQAC